MCRFSFFLTDTYLMSKPITWDLKEKHNKKDMVIAFKNILPLGNRVKL